MPRAREKVIEEDLIETVSPQRDTLLRRSLKLGKSSMQMVPSPVSLPALRTMTVTRDRDGDA